MQRKLIAASIAAAFIAAGSMAIAQPAPKLSGNGVRVAVMTDMSGLYADLGGQGSVVAAQMAVDDFIAANKPAYKIDVVSADHQNKADVAANRAREWFDTQNVDMITDLLNSAVAISVGKVANEKKRLAIVTGSAVVTGRQSCSRHFS